MNAIGREVDQAGSTWARRYSLCLTMLLVGWGLGCSPRAALDSSHRDAVSVAGTRLELTSPMGMGVLRLDENGKLFVDGDLVGQLDPDGTFQKTDGTLSLGWRGKLVVRQAESVPFPVA